jgi:hypothetical protein
VSRSAVLIPNGVLEPGPMAAILANHAIPGCEAADRADRTHTRMLGTPAGPRRVTVTIRSDDVGLTADTDDDGQFEHLIDSTGHGWTSTRTPASSPVLSTATRSSARWYATGPA